MKYVVLFIVAFAFLSCYTQREIIAKSSIKLEGKNTDIRKLIEIDGYYAYSGQRYNSMMFFEDGSWVIFGFESEIPKEERQTNMSKAVSSWKPGSKLRWGLYWGVYSIQNDTIIVHEYDIPGFLVKGWDIREQRYKVIDRKTIQEVYYELLLAPDDTYKTYNPWRNDELRYFFPADSLPPSDSWLKEEKWIWRNESDWKKYMQDIERKKKGKE
ncbi:MAG: hypothetical protein LBB62_00195 [Proteiniphilum sp.]|jgi:hypothetical protein|nr:hypothetical protein [Proteiniphilum sp.]